MTTPPSHGVWIMTLIITSYFIIIIIFVSLIIYILSFWSLIISSFILISILFLSRITWADSEIFRATTCRWHRSYQGTLHTISIPCTLRTRSTLLCHSYETIISYDVKEMIYTLKLFYFCLLFIVREIIRRKAQWLVCCYQVINIQWWLWWLWWWW